MVKAMVDLSRILVKATGAEPFLSGEGAGDALLTRIEEETGLQLPADYASFLREQGGQPADSLVVFPPGRLKFLTAEGVLRLWNELREYEDEEFFDDEEDGGRVRAVVYHQKRLPIAYHEAGTQYIFLDYIPGSKGQEGQLIFNPSEASFFVLEPTFTGLTERYVSFVESGRARVAAVSPAMGGGFSFQTSAGEDLDFEKYRELRGLP